MRPLIAGNWKNARNVAAAWPDRSCRRLYETPSAVVLICVPATLIARAAQTAAGRISIGAENCGAEISGAFTGDLSAEMLKDAGASPFILGHSERRHLHGETDAIVKAKARAARRAGLAIICIGETEAQRQAGNALRYAAIRSPAAYPKA